MIALYRLFICLAFGILVSFTTSIASETVDNDGSGIQALAFIGRLGYRSKKNDVNNNQSSNEEYPADLFTIEQRLKGAIVLHIFAAIYLFTLLAVVCNDYFLPSVKCICEDLHMPQDLAACTFMAVATTTPEFFTNVIGTATESDMGTGTIIGSLLFNTLGVAAVASLAAIKPVQLDYWPITRDSILFGCNILILILFAWDNQITLIETIIMILLFFLYFGILFQNKRVMPYIKWLLEDYLNCCCVSSYDLPTSFIEKHFKEAIVIQQQPKNPKKEPVKCLQGSLTKSVIDNNPIFMIYTDYKNNSKNVNKIRKSLWRMPLPDRLKSIWWAYTWPIKLLLTLTVPNPKTYRRLYPITFLMCICWIGLNAYLICWMVTVIGETFKINEAVMGMTFLAAGGCLPEAISSVLMIRKNEGGVGVSNSLGANSLAILMSLGVPWLIHNIIYRNDPSKSSIVLKDDGIGHNFILLFVAVVILYIVLTLARYRLKRTVGITLFIVYLIFITFGVLIQTKAFYPAIFS